ncbi:MAG: cob(I)yrinic acid a,c-diamide adenosyltransferase [Bacillota bacterium]|nr:cob(I)yrinic acid a,c-diamide adenosyltransferase [Bacillota bacterium]
MAEKMPGLIMVITGDGKGKTTAAVGQAIRALGHGYHVYMIHFLKGRDYGEFLATVQMPNLTVVRAGRDDFVNRENPDPVDLELAKDGFSKAEKAVLSGDYDLVVLDEINVAVDYGLIDEADVLELLKKKPSHVTVILTGRGASPELVKIADTVSEVLAIKHHYNSGVKCCKGIEY